MKKIKNIFLILICALLVFIPCYANAEEETGSSPNTNTETETPSENNGNEEESKPDSEEGKEKEEEKTPTIEKTIKLNKTELSLDTGETETLIATVTPEDAEVVWTIAPKEEGATITAKIDKSTGKITAGNKAETVIVTAAINDTDIKATCTVNITRTVSKDSTLSSINVDNGKISPEFKSNILEYTVTVDSNVTSLDFDNLLDNCEKENKGCQITSNSKLKNGSVVKILVTAEDGTTQKTYKFTIKKDETSLALKKLEINGYALNEVFQPEVLEYTASIPYEIETITVNASPEDSNAKVKVSGLTNLKVGRNTVTVTVTDKDGNSNKYQITVTRETEVSVEEKPTSIITSNNIDNNKPTSSNSAIIPINNGNDDNFLKYAIVSSACLILFAIGGIGVYFYLKTSPKKLRKELNNLKKVKIDETDSPMLEITDNNIETKKESSIIEVMQEDLVQTREFNMTDLENNSELEESFDDNKDV